MHLPMHFIMNVIAMVTPGAKMFGAKQSFHLRSSLLIVLLNNYDSQRGAIKIMYKLNMLIPTSWS